MHLGEVIRDLRKEAGRTLEDLAFAAGTDASNLSRVERGQQRYTPELIEKIALALGVTVSAMHMLAEGGKDEKLHPPRVAEPVIDALFSQSYLALSQENQSLVLDFMRLLLLRQGTGSE